jgi:hypothetical protein
MFQRQFYNFQQLSKFNSKIKGSLMPDVEILEVNFKITRDKRDYSNYLV